MMTRWQEDALIARIREIKAQAWAPEGCRISEHALAHGYTPERNYWDPFKGRYTEPYPPKGAR